MSRWLSRLAVLAIACNGLGSDCGRRDRTLVAVGAGYAEPAAVVAPRPAVCGDGIPVAPEECDDGNVAAGDGCRGCTVEAPQCGPGTDGVVWRWRCEGSPSRCGLDVCRSTGPDANCPPELATRTVVGSIRLEGFIDPTTADASRVRGGGLDCACRDTLGGRVCDPGCSTTVATCARTAIAATSTTAAFARWSWGCSGSAPGCVIQPDAETSVEARLEAAPISLAGAVVLDGNNLAYLTVLAVDGPGGAALITGEITAGTMLGGVMVDRDGYQQRSFVATVTPAGVIRHVIDLGDYDRVRVQGGGFTPGGGFWLLTTDGDQTDTWDERPAQHPRLIAARYDSRGHRAARVMIGHVGAGPRFVVLPSSGIALAYNPATFDRHGYDDRPEWKSDELAVVGFDPSGTQLWRHSDAGHQIWPTPIAMRATAGGDVLVAGVYRGDKPPTGALRELPAAGPMQRPFILRISSAGTLHATAPLAASDDWAGASMILGDDGDLVSLHPLRTDRDRPAVIEHRGRDGRSLWSQPLGLAALGGGSIDTASLVASAAGDRYGWIQRELDDTRDSGHATIVIRVVDGDGIYRESWSIPVRAPTAFDARAAAIDSRGRVVIAGAVTGALTLGHVRFKADQRASFVVWLDPSPHAPVGGG